jgi:hypothetical protein
LTQGKACIHGTINVLSSASSKANAIK